MRNFPAGKRVDNLRDQRKALLDFPDANPDARVDVALRQHRNFEFQFVVGRDKRKSLRASKSRPEARPIKPPGAKRLTSSGFTIPVVTVRSCSDGVSS